MDCLNDSMDVVNDSMDVVTQELAYLVFAHVVFSMMYETHDKT